VAWCIAEKKADVTAWISSGPLRIAQRRACSKHVRLFPSRFMWIRGWMRRWGSAI
jgi:hypothetical protein